MDHQYGGGRPSLCFSDWEGLEPFFCCCSQEGGVCMDVGVLIGLVSLVITCIAFGIQIGSTFQTKIDRHNSSDKD